MDGLVKMILFSLVGSNLRKDGWDLIVMALIKVQFISHNVADSSATTTIIFV
jgi:hypothetical protein